MRVPRYLPLVLLLSSPAAFAKGPAAFAKSDKNSDGVIDSEEFASSPRGWGAKLSSKRFLRLDKDQDGVVTPLEFFGQKKLSKLLSSKKKAISESITGIVSNWSQSDPAAATAWINSLPERENIDSWLGTVVELLATTDPASAASVIASLDSSERPNFYSHVVAGWAQHDPSAALQWLQSQLSRPEEEGGGRPGGRPNRPGQQ